MQAKMTIVLNGGKQVESATIPIQWFFSTKIGKLSPTHMLVIDYTEEEFEVSTRGTSGRRYIVPITDTVMFLQLLKPGTHKLCFLALSNAEGDEEDVKHYWDRTLSIDRYFGDAYNRNVSFNKDELSLENTYRLKGIASLTVTISVPKELFAEIPQTGIKRAIWNFVNGSLRGVPNDECHTRRRWFTVGIPKLLLYAPFRVILGIILTCAYPIRITIGFLAGLKPMSPWRAMKELWNFNHSILNVWYVHPGKKLPFQPWKWLLALGVVFGDWKLVTTASYDTWMSIILTIIVLGIVFGVIVVATVLSSKIAIRQRALELELERKKQRDYRDWVTTNLSVRTAPEQVDLNRLPSAIDWKSWLKRKFMVAYWATKARVCRPYAHH